MKGVKKKSYNWDVNLQILDITDSFNPLRYNINTQDRLADAKINSLIQKNVYPSVTAYLLFQMRRLYRKLS